MKTTTYQVGRVNTWRHKSPNKAKDDMCAIIEQGYFWKMSQTYYMPVGSLIIGMGSRGGRGLFIVGIVTGEEWERVQGDVEYHWRIKVQWQPVIYEHPESAADTMELMLPRFSIHSGSRNISATEFAEAFSFVASGNVLDADYHWNAQAA